MLEKVPETLGKALAGVRAGIERTLYETEPTLPATLRVTSPAFTEGGALDPRYTEDGAGTSPPLAWSNVPAGAGSLVLLVEDADSPTPNPIVHAIVHRLPPTDGGLPEGALVGASVGRAVGRNSFLKPGWLPPDPPTGHGDHRYCFQLFTLAAAAELPDEPGRGAVAEAVRAHGLTRGRLIGTYRRW